MPFVLGISANALVFRSTFAYILLPYMSLAHLFWEGLRPAFGNYTRDWMLPRTRRPPAPPTHSSLFGCDWRAGTCLFAVAPPKCENNGTQRQTERSIYSERLKLCQALKQWSKEGLVVRNMQESNIFV